MLARDSYVTGMVWKAAQARPAVRRSPNSTRYHLRSRLRIRSRKYIVDLSHC